MKQLLLFLPMLLPLVMAPAANAESVRLMLTTARGEAHSTFPMRDMDHCEEEGKRWKETEVEAINGSAKGFYCVKGK